MKADAPPAFRAAHRRGIVEMLTAEATLARDMREVLAEADRRGGGAGERVLRADMPGVVLTGRARARRASVRSLNGELEVVRAVAAKAGIDGPKDAVAMPLPRADIVASEATAAAYAASWAKWERQELVGAADRKVDLVAATETSIAYNDEHRRQTRVIATEEAGSKWFPAVFRVWDATADRRTCPVCARLDHTIQVLGLSFPGGQEPGRAHPRCRCRSAIVFLPVYLGRREERAA